MSFQLSNFLHLLTHLLLVLVIGFAGFSVLAFAVWLMLRLFDAWRLYKQDVAYLEVTPPVWSDKLPAATEQLFAALHSVGSKRFIDHLLRRQFSFSVEIVSTRAEGIRYIVRVPEMLVSSIEHTITAYLPDAKVNRSQGYFKSELSRQIKIVRFKQAKHFAFPLKNYDSLAQQDPIGYITGAMTKLNDTELIALQVVITPTYNREAASLGYQILSNEDLLSRLDKQRAPLRPKIFNALNTVLFAAIEGVSNAFHSPSRNRYYGSNYYASEREVEFNKQVSKRIRPARSLSYFEQEVVMTIHDKLSKPLFKTEIRVLLDCQTKQEALQRKRSLASALNLLSVQKYQKLQMARTRYGLSARYQRFAFMYRLPAIFGKANLLAASELASLYHFPHSYTAKTENVVKSLSKTLPAPVSLKSGNQPDIILGMNSHHGTHTPIGLTKAERERHVYIIGGTGNGKTTMLMGSIIQDIHNGKGVAVIDPHGDLATTLLKRIPKNRINDVAYLNPRDIDYPIALNLLELPKTLSDGELEQEKDLITEAIISVLRKVFSEDDTGGHRIEYVLRNTIHTALTVEGATLFTILKLLTNSVFRKEVTDKLEEQDLKDFWKEELGKAGAMQRVKMSAGVTNKIGRFRRSVVARRMLGQEHSTINFDDIMNDSKILICNFAKGRLGEDTSSLFGTAILTQLQLAAWRREELKPEDRVPFYLYVDEFQNFADKPFVQLVSESRKYKLFLTMAEQSTAQQDDAKIVETLLNNVGTVVCFKTGSERDERLLLHQMGPYIEHGDILNLPSYNFYVRISAIEPLEPMSGQTILLEGAGSNIVAEQVIASSREKYGVEYKAQKTDVRPKQTFKKQAAQKAKPNKPTPVPAAKPQAAGSISV